MLGVDLILADSSEQYILPYWLIGSNNTQLILYKSTVVKLEAIRKDKSSKRKSTNSTSIVTFT